MKTVLVTGCAGFIGFHYSYKLLKLKNFKVIGVDMINNYYDIKLKKDRLLILQKSFSNKKFSFYKINITNFNSLKTIFKKNKIDYVINLAAQAGVRESLRVPERYLDYNVKGFLNILELSNLHNIKHLIYASTSSVYGLNKKLPFSVNDTTDHPQQFYAVTKKTNELMAHVWSGLYNMRITGLRFFTVYGPFGRPDMALFRFTQNIIENKPIDLFNYGNHIRDFTYIDDIVQGIFLAMKNLPKGIKKNENLKSSNSYYKHRIYNLGCGNEVKLEKFVELIEKNLNIKALKNKLPMQKGDVYKTSADIKLSKKDLGYNPQTKVEVGIKNFVNWYKSYYKIK